MSLPEPKPLTVLIIDDDEQIRDLLREVLEPLAVSLLTAANGESGYRRFLEAKPQVVLLDLRLPDASGMDLLQRMLAADPGADIMLISGERSTEAAVEAIRLGAADYWTKPFELERLRNRIAELAEEAQRRHRALELDHEMVGAFQFQGVVGRSPLMLDVFTKMRRIAPYYRTALVRGATGTGKELVARALHSLSPRSARPFVTCNCAAIVDTLVESELFGYVRGAFTGATQDREGLFEHADGGTIFLDEIGEMPLAAQSKLLRVLQNQELQRVGSPKTRKVDVLVIAATNRDLRGAVAQKTFREDLYYRLSMVEFEIPRLSERREDLPLLQRYLVEKFAAQYGKELRGLTRRAQAALARHPWPGNVRELENVLGNACMMAQGEVVDLGDLPPYLRADPSAQDDGGDEAMLSLEEMEYRHATRVLERAGGDKSQAARILGISRATLYKILARGEAKPPAQ
jgi:DNA-binding NtrC family response regulator